MRVKAKWWQRVGSIFFVAIGAWLTAGTWDTAVNEGYFMTLGASGPAWIILGIGMLLFPMDRRELLEKHGVEKPEAFEHLPLAWKAIVPTMVLAIAVNYVALWLKVHGFF